MSYRLCFLANSVRPVGRRGVINVREEDSDDVAEQLTDEESKEVEQLLILRTRINVCAGEMDDEAT